MPDQAGDPPADRSAEIPGLAAARHAVTLTERGPFLAPACSCGWYGPARRSRPLARLEAAAHLAAAAPPDARDG